MIIAAIHVGDELLDGRVADANLRALGAFASLNGARVASARFVPDTIDAIVESLRAAPADLVVCSGGLGPTDDDRTRHAAATFAGVELIEDAETLRRIQERFAARGRTFTPNNSRQALFPAGADVLASEVGTAPGFLLHHGGKRFYFLPGVPREFSWYLEHFVASELPGSSTHVGRTIHFHGIGESSLETRLGQLPDVEVGFRADYPVIELKLAGTEEAVERALGLVEERVGDLIIGVDATLPETVGALLHQRGETVTTAESCTAGLIAGAITDVSGSSSWFERGFVTYSNDAKEDLVGVRHATLVAHGAVSPQVAAQMAAGARKRAEATWALAVSGIAGPTGGSETKPVGTVDFALSGPDGTWVRRVYFRVSDRQRVREGTAYTALQLLRWALRGELQRDDIFGPFDDDVVFADNGIEHTPLTSPS